MLWQIHKQHSRNQVRILLGICKDVAESPGLLPKKHELKHAIGLMR